MSAQATTEIGRTQNLARSRGSAAPWAIWGRVSRVGDRDEKLRSPEVQESIGRAFAEREGLEVDEVVIGIDVSGAKVTDSELMRLVERVERGELAGIIVPKLDRLSRLPARDRLELLERIGEARLLSATESNDVTTPQGRFVRDLFFGLARMEWEDKAESISLAKRNAVERGAYIANRAPFGYRFGAGHVLEVVEAEAEVVVELFELRATGASWGAVLDLFERRTGRSSHRQTVAAMLKNRAYIGAAVYGRKPETRLVNESAHVAIVELDLWERVQAVNAERAGLGPGEGHHAGAPVSLLAGYARCAGCRRGLTKSAGVPPRRDVYRCPSTAAKCPARASIGVAELDRYVGELLLEWAGAAADEVVSVELEQRDDRAGAVHRLAEAERVALEYEANVELELEVGSEAYASGRQARRALVERRRQELAAIGEASELDELRATLREVWDDPETTLEERRRLLGVALGGIVVRRTPRLGAPVEERARVSFVDERSAAAELA
jgi:DNA invertase Pin-like site-specific DNA recombinase